MLLAVTGIGLLMSLQCLTRGKEIWKEQCGLLAQYFYYEDRLLVINRQCKKYQISIQI